jgi:hypothetical protein
VRIILDTGAGTYLAHLLLLLHFAPAAALQWQQKNRTGLTPLHIVFVKATFTPTAAAAAYVLVTSQHVVPFPDSQLQAASQRIDPNPVTAQCQRTVAPARSDTAALTNFLTNATSFQRYTADPDPLDSRR